MKLCFVCYVNNLTKYVAIHIFLPLLSTNVLFCECSNRTVNKRFGRLESHVVTLARSVAHLSSELRSQASISQDVDDMRRQVQDQQFRTDENVDLARESALLQSRVKKLRRYIQLC